VLYGVTEFGGSGPCNTFGFVGCGTVYKVALNPPSETVLYNFPGPAFPIVQLLEQGNSLIGSTEFSGTVQSPAAGTVFNLVGGNETVLAPSLAVTGNMVALDGAIFGTAGPGNGIVFKLTPPANVMAFWTVKTIYTFKGGSDGSTPNGLVYSNEAFYGTTQAGGPNGAGTVFKVTRQGVETVLYAFCSQPSCADGALPLAGVIVANGALYGTTRNGGNGQGVVFKVTPHGESALYRFCPQAPCVDGAYPYAGVIEVDGSLYGATAGGGTANFGAVFKLSL